MTSKTTSGRHSAGSSAIHSLLVAAGIFLSRVAGLVRDRVFAHYFGNSAAADAFRAAFRIPNFLQNLFGEGVLSASFIPVYAGLRAQGRHEEAERVAGAVFGLLALLVSGLVLLGVLASPWLVDAIAPGFAGAKRDLTVTLVRVLFPGMGMLVLSAWCLGILNSHRKFFLSYTAPVVWNAAIVAALVGWGGAPSERLVVIVSWGSVAGSLLQFSVQLPAVWKCRGTLAVSCRSANPDVRKVVRNFGPVFLGRGAYQISSFADALIASLLPTGAVAAMAYGQTLYMLPVSLFGMSVSAAELPSLSEEAGGKHIDYEALRKRVGDAARRMSFFVIPACLALLALGDLITAALYQTGRFTRDDTLYVWSILAGASLGLPAATFARLLASVFYAFQDTRSPLRICLVRVGAGIALGFAAALWLPGVLGLDPRWGVAGLALAASAAGWLEFGLLFRRLRKKIGVFRFPWREVALALLAAALSAGLAWLVRPLGRHLGVLVGSLLPLAVYSAVYLVFARVAGLPEARRILSLLGRVPVLGRLFPR